MFAGACCHRCLHLEANERLDEVVGLRAAVRAGQLRGELREAHLELAQVDDLLVTAVALYAAGAAGQRRKHVVGVHGANLVDVAVPRGQAVLAGDLINAHHAGQADG